MRTLLASAYLTGLTQYRGSGRGALRGTTLVASSVHRTASPTTRSPNSSNDQITLGTVPGPDPDNEAVYSVVLPTGVTPESPGWTGEHNSYKRSGQRIPYAWFSNAGDLASLTGIISHDLVEGATDPDGSGFLGAKGTCDGPGWCEIADVCQPTWSTVDGVTVQGYWSNQDNDCIVPSSVTPNPSRRGRLGTRPCIRRPDMPRVKRLDPAAASVAEPRAVSRTAATGRPRG